MAMNQALSPSTFATFEPRTRSRSVSTTCQPSLISQAAIPRPMPRAAPVTSATRPLVPVVDVANSITTPPTRAPDRLAGLQHLPGRPRCGSGCHEYLPLHARLAPDDHGTWCLGA